MLCLGGVFIPMSCEASWSQMTELPALSIELNVRFCPCLSTSIHWNPEQVPPLLNIGGIKATILSLPHCKKAKQKNWFTSSSCVYNYPFCYLYSCYLYSKSLLGLDFLAVAFQKRLCASWVFSMFGISSVACCYPIHCCRLFCRCGFHLKLSKG